MQHSGHRHSQLTTVVAARSVFAGFISPPEVSISPDTVAPQMVLPLADLPATNRSSPGRPLVAIQTLGDQSWQWVASSVPWEVLTSQLWSPAVEPAA